MKPASTRPSLARSIPFWALLVVSLGLAAGGVLVISQHLATMTKTLGDGSATGVEVYAGQSWIVVGAALVGAGALGVLLVLALAAASSLIPVGSSVIEAGADGSAQEDVDAVATDGDQEDTKDALDEPAAAVTR